MDKLLLKLPRREDDALIYANEDMSKDNVNHRNWKEPE